LNQRVVFQGNLVGETNTFNAAPNGVAADLAPAQQAATQSGQPVFFQNVSQIQGTRIQGQATIGGSNRIEINAVPVSP
jgi:CO/xanthine dehydrogenase FAD-binding subunit